MLRLLSRFVVCSSLICAGPISGCRPSSTLSDESKGVDKSLSALSAAAKRGDATAIESLLAAGANPNALGSDHFFPLQYAASSGKIAAVQALLAGGADVRSRAPDGSTALHSAAVDREVAIAELLIAAGSDVNAKTVNNVTPLMASIGSPYSDAKMSMLLMRAGADVNVADSEGETALLIAATNGSDDVFEALLRKGANPNTPGKALGYPGYTPLHMAALNGSTKKVELLLQHGADPTVRNDEGQTPLEITNVKFEEVRKLLSSFSRNGR
jgi:uncharacterized protein